MGNQLGQVNKLLGQKYMTKKKKRKRKSGKKKISVCDKRQHFRIRITMNDLRDKNYILNNDYPHRIFYERNLEKKKKKNDNFKSEKKKQQKKLINFFSHNFYV